MNRDGLSMENPVEEFRQPVRAATPAMVAHRASAKSHPARDGVRALAIHLGFSSPPR